MLIDGIHIPLTMPFTRDGEIYLRKLEYNVRRYSLGPAAGLVALTAAFEGTALSDEETREALEVIGSSAAAEKVLVAAIARDSVRHALQIAQGAAAAGFDAVLLSAPRNAMLSDEELLVYLLSVADASPLPVVLGSSNPGDALPLDAMAELAQHRNVVGLYDDALTLERFRVLAEATKDVQREVPVTTVFSPVTGRMLSSGSGSDDSAAFVAAESLTASAAVAVKRAPKIKTRTRTVGFQIMSSGSAQDLTELLKAGVAGAMPTLSACAPQACHEAYAALKDGNTALAAEKSHRLLEADTAIGALGIAGVKHGCDWNGYYGGAPRLPRLPLRVLERERIEQVLVGIRN